MTGALVMIALAAWAAHHAVRVSHFGHAGGRLAVVWLVTFFFIAAQTVFFLLERPRRMTPRVKRRLDNLNVALLIPAFNEDDGYLRLSLDSILAQERKPNSVHIVDDGSTDTEYAAIRKWWKKAARRAGIATTWQRVLNGGKRHAQGHAIRLTPEADVYVTVDSDSCLDAKAVQELLLPFANPRVMSVAGVIMATNNRGPQMPQRTGRSRAARRQYRKQRLTWPLYKMMCRVTDLWLVTSQLVDRSSLSAVGSVMVNSGPLAAYRADVVREHLDGYLNETFAGKPVNLSDDSLLTLYAILHGKTVQQPTAFAFSAMPEKYNHLQRMYLRWMRGSTIRSLWRLRYLPLTKLAYWIHLSRWFQVAITTIVLAWLLIVAPFRHGTYPSPLFLLVPFIVGWAQGLRYLTVTRSDETTASRLLTWSMMPIAVMFSWTVLRWLRWYGVITCTDTDWGTRQNGAEVSLGIPVPKSASTWEHDDDTVAIRTLPQTGVHRLYDPDTTLTTELPIPGNLRHDPTH